MYLYVSAMAVGLSPSCIRHLPEAVNFHKIDSRTGLPDFSRHNITKRVEINQITTKLPNEPKYTK
jgi:hypothetical protein